MEFEHQQGMELDYGVPVTSLWWDLDRRSSVRWAFSFDMGWAGKSGSLGSALASGIGLSHLGGVIRLDLAFALKGANGMSVCTAGNKLV